MIDMKSYRTIPPSRSNSGVYERYYMNQVGKGLPIFSGPALQKGYGLGGILGGLLRSAVPLLKQGAKAVGKQALRSGLGLAQDALSGQNVKASAKKRLREAGNTLTSQAMHRMTGAEYGRKRQKAVIKRSGGGGGGGRGRGGGGGGARKTIKRKSRGGHFSSRSGKRARRSRDIFD